VPFTNLLEEEGAEEECGLALHLIYAHARVPLIQEEHVRVDRLVEEPPAAHPEARKERVLGNKGLGLYLLRGLSC